jgi:hypothetical protein
VREPGQPRVLPDKYLKAGTNHIATPAAIEGFKKFYRKHMGVDLPIEATKDPTAAGWALKHAWDAKSAAEFAALAG